MNCAGNTLKPYCGSSGGGSVLSPSSGSHGFLYTGTSKVRGSGGSVRTVVVVVLVPEVVCVPVGL